MLRHRQLLSIGSSSRLPYASHLLTASTCSTAVSASAKRTNSVHVTGKRDSSFDWLGWYDRDIVGDAPMGVDMGLTGACPRDRARAGCAQRQRQQSIVTERSDRWDALVKWNQRHKQLTTTDKSTKHSVSEATGFRDSHTMLGLEAALLSMLFATNAFAPRCRGDLSHPVAGGVLIGLPIRIACVHTPTDFCQESRD
jgi:hypothetical protein